MAHGSWFPNIKVVIVIDYTLNINMFLIIFYLYGFSTTISHIRNSENVNTK